MNFEKDLDKALKEYELSLVEHYQKLPNPKRRKAMKGKKNWYLGLAGIAAALVLLVFAQGILPGAKYAAAPQEESRDYMSGGYEGEVASAAEAPMEELKSDSGVSSDESNSGEKIIHTYNLRIETKDIKASLDQLEALVKKEGGFVENAQQSGKMVVGEEASAYYILRIPREKADVVESELEKLGQMLYFSKQQDNVTKSYKDTEARAALLKAKEDKLMELLEKAESLEDLIAVESMIMDLQFEREQLQAYLKDLDQQIELDTYYVDFIQVKVFTEKGFVQKVKDSFSEGLAGFWRFLENSLLFIVYNWTFLLLLGALALAVGFFVKAMRKKNKTGL